MSSHSKIFTESYDQILYLHQVTQVNNKNRIKQKKLMDNKNVFIAIALSMSVLLFWAAFFETPKEPNNQQSAQKEQKNLS